MLKQGGANQIIKLPRVLRVPGSCQGLVGREGRGNGDGESESERQHNKSEGGGGTVTTGRR